MELVALWTALVISAPKRIGYEEAYTARQMETKALSATSLENMFREVERV